MRIPLQQVLKALLPESNQNMSKENGLGDDWQRSRHARCLVERVIHGEEVGVSRQEEEELNPKEARIVQPIINVAASAWQ